MRAYLKASALGFLANVLGLLTFILIIYLALTVFSLVFTTVDELARATGALASDRSILELIGDSIIGSVRNALKGLWDVRLGFLIFGVLGIFAAWSHQTGLMVYAERAWLLSLIFMAVIITVSIITWTFTQREEVAVWMAEAPETYRWRDVLLRSYATDVSVGLIFALTIAYPIWAVWRWWYVRLWAWRTLAMPMPAPVEAPGHVARDEQRSYAARLHELKRQAVLTGSRPDSFAQVTAETAPPSSQSLLGQMLGRNRLIVLLTVLFVACVALYVPVNRYHDRVAMRLQHDTVFLDASSQPHQEFVVRVEPGAHRLRVVNVNGLGTVSVYLSPTADYRQAVESVRDWTFEWRSDEYLYADIPVAELEPGDYHLHFVQEVGWGYFEYTLSHGGGRVSHLAALTTGFLLACSLVLGLALIFVVLARAGLLRR